MTRKLLRGARDAKERPRDHGTDRLRLLKDGRGVEWVEQGEKEQGHMLRAERAYYARCHKCQASIGFEPFVRVTTGDKVEHLYHHPKCTGSF